MDDNRKELYKQIYKEKREEYDRVFNKKYRRISGALLLVSLWIISWLNLYDNIYACAFVVLIYSVFTLWWEKRKKNEK